MSDDVAVHHGDALDVLAGMPDASVDAVVTDPPAGIAFMGKKWDDFRRSRDEFVTWLTAVLTECQRVSKPGAHAVVWALPRTSGWTHRAIEDAGWEVRDCVTHLFGSGFPKSLDVSKAIDRAAGAAREVTGVRSYPREGTTPVTRKATTIYENGADGENVGQDSNLITAPATDDAHRWQGWGTALKPGSEHWWLARKPLSGTVASTVLAHGTGALNIDGCRVEGTAQPFGNGSRRHGGQFAGGGVGEPRGPWEPTAAGRWPANVVLDEDAAAQLDRQSGERPSGGSPPGEASNMGLRGNTFTRQRPPLDSDSGGASRFYYTAKAAPDERPRVNGVSHPTIKPLELMRWLVRLVTPPGGLVLDPFAGSGTTGEACIIEGFRAVLIEREADYLPLIDARLSKPIQPTLGGTA